MLTNPSFYNITFSVCIVAAVIVCMVFYNGGSGGDLLLPFWLKFAENRSYYGYCRNIRLHASS